MATSRPFAYNTGNTINGSLQLGRIAIGIDAMDYSGNIGTEGERWWMGPDEELGYVICVPDPSFLRPTKFGVHTGLGFFRTEDFTDESFLSLVNTIARSYNVSNFNNVGDAEAWLILSGFPTTYNYNWNLITPSITPTLSLTPSRTPSTTPSISLSRTPSITPSISFSQTPSKTPGASQSVTPSITPSISLSRTPSITPSISFSRTPSITPSISFSRTPSITPSISFSLTPSKTPGASPSMTPSITPSIGGESWVTLTSDLIIYRKGIRDGYYVIDKSEDGGSTWDLDLVQIALDEDSIIMDIDDGIEGYRHVIRNGEYCIDHELDATGFGGTENINWENVFRTK